MKVVPKKVRFITLTVCIHTATGGPPAPANKIYVACRKIVYIQPHPDGFGSMVYVDGNNVMIMAMESPEEIMDMLD